MDFSLDKPLYQLWSGDSALVADLGTYEGRLCIFTTKVIPAAAPRPYIWSWGQLSASPYESKDLIGREIFKDAWIVCDDVGSEILINQMCSNFLTVTHRAEFSIEGGVRIVCDVEGPRNGIVDAQAGVTRGLTARIFTIRAIVFADQP